jgi:hypothetical protein
VWPQQGPTPNGTVLTRRWHHLWATESGAVLAGRPSLRSQP